jgi:O-antigen/teichoic acid export membrane protein
MKNIANSFYYNPKYKRSLQWFKLIAMTGVAQVLIQALGLISGILIVRLLPTKEYAFYTIANTMLGTITLLADGGISNGVISQGGKVWNDKRKLGSVIVTGLDLRKKFAVVGLLVVTPLLMFLLKHNGASWLMCILIILSLIPAFLAALSDSLLEVAPKLLQDIKNLQKNQVSANVGRFIMLGIFLFLFPWTYIAILASGIPRIYANMRLRKISSKYADFDEQPDPQVRKEILVLVKRILPGAIYYCFSAQITIWLISIVGSTTAIARVGALGRLTMVLSLFSVMFTTLISPRFARLPNNPDILLSRFVQIQLGLLLLSGIVIVCVWIFSSQLLWILGKSYSNLQHEILLNMIGACLTLISGCAYSLYTYRGWSINPLISIPIDFAGILVAVLLINVSTVIGVFLFNIFVASVQVLLHGSFCLIKIKGIKYEGG